eukprot:6983646-Pyramimonas_sp.AAC.2
MHPEREDGLQAERSAVPELAGHREPVHGSRVVRVEQVELYFTRRNSSDACRKLYRKLGRPLCILATLSCLRGLSPAH